MPETVLRDQRVWLDGLDLTGVMNSIALEAGAELEDGTTFGMATRKNVGGLKTVLFQLEGLYDADPTESELFARLGQSGHPLSLADSDTVGAVAYTFRATDTEHELGGAVGALNPLSIAAGAAGDLIRGRVMHASAEAASGNGAAVQIGQAGAAQSIYAAVHVLSAAGTTPTLDITVESDNAQGFASPVTRLTVPQLTAVGSVWATPVAGPVTDDWWRVAFAIGGGSPSFDFVAVVGVQ